MEAELSSRPCGIFVRKNSYGTSFCPSTWISFCQYNSFSASYSHFINLSLTVLIVDPDSFIKRNTSLLRPPPPPFCSPQFCQAKSGIGLKIHQVGVIVHSYHAEFTIYSSSRFGLYRVYLNAWTKFKSGFAKRKQCIWTQYLNAGQQT